MSRFSYQYGILGSQGSRKTSCNPKLKPRPVLSSVFKVSRLEHDSTIVFERKHASLYKHATTFLQYINYAEACRQRELKCLQSSNLMFHTNFKPVFQIPVKIV